MDLLYKTHITLILLFSTIPMSYFQVHDTFQDYVSTPSNIPPDNHFNAEKQVEGGKNGYNDNNSDQNYINSKNSYIALETNHAEKTNQEINQLQGKMWKEKIRVREREEKKKRLIEVKKIYVR